MSGCEHEGGSEPGVPQHIKRVDTLAEISGDWQELANAADDGIFSTWEWADSWWRARGRDDGLELHSVRDQDGVLIAVLPLYAWRSRGLRVLRFLGHGPGDELGPLHRQGAHPQAAAALRSTLESIRWDIVAAEQLPGSEGWPELLGGILWRREASPVLRVPAGGWQEILDARSSNFRQELRRRERNLRRAATARFRLSDARSLERDLDCLFALHTARWAGRRTDFTAANELREFHRVFARRVLGRGWLRLWLLELDDRPAAAWYGFHVGSVASYYQAGRDPRYDRESVGSILLAHSIREAIAEGAREYRFGRGDEPFKARFADDDPGLETVVVTRKAGGNAMIAAAAVKAARYLRAARRRS